ncbi:uncharacterized protein [Scyliorhinus torazame]
MELQFTLLFLSLLLGHAGALKCYKCQGIKCDQPEAVEVCAEGQMCMTRLDRQHLADKTITKSCVSPEMCANVSLNLGYLTSEIHCCIGNLCNNVPDQQKANNLLCLGCLKMLGDFKCNRSGPIPCEGSQTKCGSLEGFIENGSRHFDFRGCVSESICSLNSTEVIFGIDLQKRFQCCDGNLCNRSSRTETGALGLIVLCLCLLIFNNN